MSPSPVQISYWILLYSMDYWDPQFHLFSLWVLFFVNTFVLSTTMIIAFSIFCRNIYKAKLLSNTWLFKTLSYPASLTGWAPPCVFQYLHSKLYPHLVSWMKERILLPALSLSLCHKQTCILFSFFPSRLVSCCILHFSPFSFSFLWWSSVPSDILNYFSCYLKRCVSLTKYPLNFCHFN